MNLKTAGSFAVLLCATAATWYLARSLEQPEPATDDGSTWQSGYYLRNARILGTGENGELLYEIEAEYAEQQAGNEITFDQVQVRYSPAADVPWSLSADRARITGNLEQLTLSGHVLAVSTAGFSGEVTEIRTEQLQLEPEAYRAHTDQRVQIRIGERSVTATGMEALLDENRLELKSNVSGKFIP